MLAPLLLALVAVLPVPQAAHSDPQAITHHIDTIFRAYIEKDRERILNTHTQDWLGFQSRSLALVRGIEGYMVNADRALANGGGTEHEMLAIEPRVWGDLAVAPYLARYRVRSPEGELSIVYRSIDVYRRTPTGWNQCGTNICILVDDPIHYPTAGEFEAWPQLRPSPPAPSDSIPAPSAAALSTWKKRRADELHARILVELTRESLDLQIREELAPLAALRSDDWIGFGLASTAIRTREDAPENGELSGRSLSWSVLEQETQLEGEMAVVYALLRGTPRDEGPPALVRTCDLYRRTAEGWQQCASHPNPFPDVLAGGR